MNSIFKTDFYRVTNGKKYTFFNFIKYFIRNHEVRFLYFYRHQNICNKLFLRKMKIKYGLEINSNNIGAGFCLGHPYLITINPNAIIGKNCNIHKGVTIGQENRGKRKGSPKIGNEVWIGINATIVGNVNIGNNVLIAANSFVNCDIPSNSIVYGNPCIIKANENATKGYINYIESK